MKNKLFSASAAVFLVNILLDAVMFYAGFPILGLFCLTGTLLIFAIGVIWFIYRDDEKIEVKNTFLVLPLTIFTIGLIKFFKKNQIFFQQAPENLLNVGNIMMSRYQVAVWLLSVLLLVCFVLAGSLLVRNNE